MEDKIRILFYNRDAAGVNYFRTQTPAVELERNHSDKFFVEINSDIDFNNTETIDETIKYLKSFHIIHYHRTIIQNPTEMLNLIKELKAAGVILIMDIDDYWVLDRTHPFYSTSIEHRLDLDIKDNLKMADYVTTTTELFASEIRKVTGKDNVTVLHNAVNPSWMKQFKDNKEEDPDGLVRISYMSGSSHRKDMEQLIGVANRLNSDPQTKGKFKIIVAKCETEGTKITVRVF